MIKCVKSCRLNHRHYRPSMTLPNSGNESLRCSNASSVNLLLCSGEPGDPAGTEELLYNRTVRDFAALQVELAVVRHALSDREQMLRVLRENGHEVDSTRQHLTLVGAMDRALQHLVHLIQYDTRDRAEIDIRNGFQLASGSTNYGRFYFAPPKENSGN